MKSFPALHPALTTPALWHPEAPRTGYIVLLFRRRFDLGRDLEATLHLSASQRFILYLDGEVAARGPSRSDPDTWKVSRVPVRLPAGSHTAAVCVAHLGSHAGKGQLGRRGFFLAASEDPVLHGALGTAGPWRVARDPSRTPHAGWGGVRMRGHFAAGDGEAFDASLHPRGWTGPDFDDTGWENAVQIAPGAVDDWGNLAIDHLLEPDPLPLLHDQPPRRPLVRIGELPASVPARTRHHSLLLDAGELVNAYPRFTFEGGAGAVVRITACEAPVDPRTLHKGHRDRIEGKSFPGPQDEVRPGPGGSCIYEPLWFRSFRYLHLEIETADHPLRMAEITFRPTGYPLRPRTPRLPANPAIPWDRLLEITARTAALCCHETLFDCPHYEQAQFPGDTRVLARYLYRLCDDDLPVRKAIADLHASRRPNGLILSHHPSTFLQILPTYSLQWLGCLHDFLIHRKDPDFLRPFVPAAREIVEWFRARLRSDGLPGRIGFAPFIDWSPAFEKGNAPQDPSGGSALVAALLCQSARNLAALEIAAGYPELAPRWNELAQRLHGAVRTACFDPGSGIFFDTPARRSVSVHAQVESCLAGILDPGESAHAIDRTWNRPGVAQPGTFYYLAFLLDALDRARLHDRIPELLGPFLGLLEETGLTTWPESIRPDPRGDCHGWSILPALVACHMELPA